MQIKNMLLGSLLSLAIVSGTATPVSAAGDESKLPETTVLRGTGPNNCIWVEVTKPYFDHSGELQHERCTKTRFVSGRVRTVCSDYKYAFSYLYSNPRKITKEDFKKEGTIAPFSSSQTA